MPTVEFEGHTFNVDKYGFLDDFDNWNEAWIRYVQLIEGVEELTEDHRKVINVFQDYYRKNGIAPMVRIVTKVTGFKLKYIYELFPSGPGKGACGAPPTEVGGTNAPASAKPAEAHPPALIMLAINAAIRRIANTASVDTISAFIRQLELAAFCEGG